MKVLNTAIRYSPTVKKFYIDLKCLCYESIKYVDCINAVKEFNNQAKKLSK